MIKTILLPTDFSIEAQELLSCIEQFKSIGLEKVILLHVIDVVHAQGMTPLFEKHAKGKLEEYKQFIEEKGLKAETLISEGDIPKTIVNVAKMKNVDCIVIGSTTGGLIKSLFLGSTSEYVARKSKNMVLVEKYRLLEEDYKSCKKFCETAFQKVLIPIDFSDESLEAVKKIKRLNGKDKELILVHVIEKAKSHEELKKQKSEALKKLEKIGSEMEGFNTKYYVVEGVPPDEINKLATEEDATLIALANKGRGLVKDILIGSTAENLLRKTTRPVLIIPVNR